MDLSRRTGQISDLRAVLPAFADPFATTSQLMTRTMDSMNRASRIVPSPAVFWALVAAGLIVLCGCPERPPGTNRAEIAQPFKGQEVALIVPASLQLPALWEVVAQEWMEQTGATLRWNEYVGEGGKSLQEMLAEPVPSGGRIILFPLQELSNIDRYLAAIDTTKTSELDLKDVFKGLRERIVSRNRTPVAVPTSAPVLLCYYRADLLKAAGLKPPETWDDYQTLIDTLDRWAPGLTAVEPLAAGSGATLLSARTLAYAKHPENYSVWFDLESGDPMLNSAGFQEAIAVATRAWKKMPPSIMELSPLECRQQILAGKAALAIGQEPVSGTKSASSERAPAIEVGVCRLPGSRRVYNTNSKRWDVLPQGSIHAPGLCAFDGSAVGVGLGDGGTKDAAAWHLFAILVGAQFETNWAHLPKSPCRESQVSTATSWNESGLTLEEASRAVDATAQMLRDHQVVSASPTSISPDLNQLIDKMIGRLLKEDLDPEMALQQLQTEFEELLSKVGKETFRSDYRRGLGLPPLETLPSSR